MPGLFSNALDDFLDALYPPLCPLGGARCSVPCAEHVLPDGLTGSRCRRCAVRLSDALPDRSLCASCRRDPPGFARVVGLGDYHVEPVREWVLAMKHGGRTDLARPLACALARLVGEAGGVPGALFVPVPLHPLRRIERGYDQAWLLAREVARATGGTASRLLRRARWTPPQGASGARSRSANVRDAFRVRKGVSATLGRRPLWLVDDVVTSGATASACARALRHAGAGDVTVVCVAVVDENRTVARRAEPANG